MAHYYRVEDSYGELVDLVTLCSDWCHREWCDQAGVTYEGWDGCHELEFGQKCENCGEWIGGVYDGEEVTA